MGDNPIDIIYGERVTSGVDAEARSNGLWVTAAAMERAAGWTLKPEGFCKAETCIPVPPSRRGDFVAGGRYNLAALAGLIGQPVVHDDEHRVWCFGE